MEARVQSCKIERRSREAGGEEEGYRVESPLCVPWTCLLAMSTAFCIAVNKVIVFSQVLFVPNLPLRRYDPSTGHPKVQALSDCSSSHPVHRTLRGVYVEFTKIMTNPFTSFNESWGTLWLASALVLLNTLPSYNA